MVEKIQKMWAVSPLLVVIFASLSILLCSSNDKLKVVALIALIISVILIFI
jgi:hypothetical protein